MAEAICEHCARGRVRAASAGDTPAVQVSPYALECLRAHGVATRGLRSKPWGEFFGLYRAPVRFVISLCEVDASKSNWDQGASVAVKARWEMRDPGTVGADGTDIRLAYEETFAALESRIRKFLALPLGRLTDPALAQELALIGQEP
jgi:arsenate reductase